MSERIVDNPANHGWVEENGKWVWDGKREVELEAGNAGGQITTWDGSKWTPEGAVVVNATNGNVGIGSSTNSQYQLSVSGDSRFGVDGCTSRIRSLTAGESATGVQATELGVLSGGAELHIGKPPRSSTSSNQHKNIFNAHTHEFETNGVNRLTIDSTGDATFGGNVEANANGAECILTPNYATEAGAAGLLLSRSAQKANVFLMCQNGGAPVFSVGPTGNTRAGGQQLIGTRDLIETLATLRASTLDETVDVRQALTSACDKLIKKFEAMQNEAVTQDIQESPVTEES